MITLMLDPLCFTSEVPSIHDQQQQVGKIPQHVR